MDNLESKIRQTISNITGLASDVRGDADLYLDLGVASVHAIELLTSLEEQFGITVPDDEFVEATSIDKLTALISGLVNASARA